MARKRKQQSNEVRVRATRNLPGLQAGREADVDPKLPWVAAALENSSLVKVDGPSKETKDKE